MMMESTYNESEGDDIPCSVDHVHSPANICNADGHDEDEKTATCPCVSYRPILKEIWLIDLRQGIERELRDGQPIGSDRVVHDLGRVQVEERRPGKRVEPLEEEHDGDVSVHEALRGTVGVTGVHLGQTADDEQAEDEESLRDERGGPAAPFCDEEGAEKGAEETPDVQDDVLRTRVSFNDSQ
jgi:hypothetical protein